MLSGASSSYTGAPSDGTYRSQNFGGNGSQIFGGAVGGAYGSQVSYASPSKGGKSPGATSALSTSARDGAGRVRIPGGMGAKKSPCKYGGHDPNQGGNVNGMCDRSHVHWDPSLQPTDAQIAQAVKSSKAGKKKK